MLTILTMHLLRHSLYDQTSAYLRLLRCVEEKPSVDIENAAYAFHRVSAWVRSMIVRAKVRLLGINAECGREDR